jgi:hypothetical protein
MARRNIFQLFGIIDKILWPAICFAMRIAGQTLKQMPRSTIDRAGALAPHPMGCDGLA